MYVFQASIYWLKVNNKNTRTICEICLMVSILLTLKNLTHYTGVFIAKFVQVNTSLNKVVIDPS